MKKIIFVVMFVISCMFASNSFAKDYNVGTICNVQVSTGNLGYIHPCDTWTSVAGNKNYWIMWNMEEGQGKAMYSSAMVAFLAGEAVTVRIDESSNETYYDETKIIRINRQ